jgi:hypothetical protein
MKNEQYVGSYVEIAAESRDKSDVYKTKNGRCPEKSSPAQIFQAGLDLFNPAS